LVEGTAVASALSALTGMRDCGRGDTFAGLSVIQPITFKSASNLNARKASAVTCRRTVVSTMQV
jgi:hypothetical protein